jgi:AMP deaminase
VVKVDTHIHLAAGMTAKFLLDFIKRKTNQSPQDVVLKNAKGEPVTLSELFQQFRLQPDQLTATSLDVYVVSQIILLIFLG